MIATLSDLGTDHHQHDGEVPLVMTEMIGDLKDVKTIDGTKGTTVIAKLIVSEESLCPVVSTHVHQHLTSKLSSHHRQLSVCLHSSHQETMLELDVLLLRP